jgi:hypothetical protein
MTTARARLQSTLIVVATALGLWLLATPESGGQGKDKAPEPKYVQGEDHLKGKARWEWQLLDSGGKELDKGTFMGYVDGKICHGTEQKQVGTWKSTAKGTLAVSFTWPRLKGNWNFKLVNNNPPTYEAAPSKAGAAKATKKKPAAEKVASERLLVKCIND